MFFFYLVDLQKHLSTNNLFSKATAIELEFLYRDDSEKNAESCRNINILCAGK